MKSSPHIVPSDREKKDLRIIGEVVRVLADASQTSGCEIFEQLGPEGVGPPPHSHPWDEAFFVIEGEMDLVVGDRSLVMKAGGFAYVPAGTVHAFRYRAGGGRFVSFTSRGGAARFFGALATALPEGSVDIPTILDVASKHEIHIAPPPAP